jgi:hypothetical protein
MRTTKPRSNLGDVINERDRWDLHTLEEIAQRKRSTERGWCTRTSRLLLAIRSDPIQHRKWRRLREMHTYGAATSPPSLVQQVWWRDRLDQQHDSVVLMVEIFCSRASPTCSHEREKWRGNNWPAARVGRERGCAPVLPYIGGWAASLAPPPSLGQRPKGEEWGASFPPSF